jgi:hypothetical protein
MLEYDRIKSIEDRDGVIAALEFAKTCLKIYRSCVLHSRRRGFNKPHHGSTAAYRRGFINSYLSFKRYIACHS